MSKRESRGSSLGINEPGPRTCCLGGLRLPGVYRSGASGCGLGSSLGFGFGAKASGVRGAQSSRLSPNRGGPGPKRTGDGERRRGPAIRGGERRSWLNARAGGGRWGTGLRVLPGGGSGREFGVGPNEESPLLESGLKPEGPLGFRGERVVNIPGGLGACQSRENGLVDTMHSLRLTLL